MERYFTLQEAQALLPEVARRMRRVADLYRAAVLLQRRAEERATGNGHDRQAVIAGESLRRDVAWFREQGIQVKGLEPALVDFPALAAAGVVLLCWREGEERIGWYHTPDAGFAGRRPLEELEWI